MRKFHLLAASVGVLLPLAATARAGAPVTLPAPIGGGPILGPVQFYTQPTLTVAPVVGASQTLAVDGGALTPDCSAWSRYACSSLQGYPTLTSDGTGGNCANATYLACCPSMAAVCAPWLATLYDQTAKANANAAGAPFPMPPSMPSVSASAAGIAYAAAPLLASNVGTGSTVLGKEMVKFTASPYVSSTPGPLANALATAQAAYDSAWAQARYSGQRITSCDDYVWDKWAGYARWEDAARAGANDPYYVALGTFAAFGAPPVRSDGTPISLNGTAFAYQITAGQTMPRNAFLSFVPDWLSASDPSQAAILLELRDEQAHPFVMGSSSSVGSPAQESNDVTWAQECTNSEDDDCETLGVVYPWGEWSAPGAIGATINSPLQPSLQAEAMQTFGSEQQRMDAYANLLGELADLRVQMVSVERQMTSYQSSNGRTTQSSIPIVYPVVSAPLLNGAPPPSSSVPTPTFRSYYFPHTSARRAAAVSYVSQAMALPVTQWPSGSVPTFPAPTGNQVILNLQTQLNAIVTQVATVQQQITLALVNEWNATDRGCLLGLDAGGGWSPQTANSCDWSPEAFVQGYMARYEAQRQTAYDRCIADTGNVFPPPSGASSVFVDPAKQATDWTANLSEFELYLSDYENRDAINATYKAALAAAEQSFLDESTNVPVQGTGCSGPNHGGSTASGCSATIGETSGDTHSIGGKYFGASVSYGGNWWATAALQPASGAPNGERQIQSLSADVNASLLAQAFVLTKTVTIVDAAVDVSSKPGSVSVNKAHLDILGDDIWQGPEGDSFSTTQTLAPPPFVGPTASAGFSIIIPILCIPVKVAAGLDLTVGATMSATLSPPPATPTPSNLTLSLGANATPYATVDANAQVGVDLLVVSAGIEANLELMNVSMPTTANLALVNQNGGLALQTTFKNPLELNEMAGSVDLYAEVDLVVWSDKATISLGSWPGFHQEVPLINRTSTWPLDAINYRLFGQVDPNAVP